MLIRSWPVGIIDFAPLFNERKSVVKKSQVNAIAFETRPVGVQAAEGVILQFIQQYFQIYDSDDREPLGAAYHQDALFSLTCSYPPGNKTPKLNSL